MGSCISSLGHQGLQTAGEQPWKKEIDAATAEALAIEAEKDEQLAGVEGRLCSNGASSLASIYTQQGKKGINQDSMIIWEKFESQENFGSHENISFLGVFDGHGPYGHLVSKRVRNSLPGLLVNQWQELLLTEWPSHANLSNFEADDSNKFLNDSDGAMHKEESNMFAAWKESHLRAFKVMDKELKLHPILDCFCSGTTAVTVIKQGRDLVIANVGDSRAILGTMSADGSLSAIQLTVDLKPTLPGEAERIKQCKGRVHALKDEPHVHRVWLPNENSPGLAMTRAFGDFCLKDFGVIAVPEITHRQLTSRDQFIVLATDGVWEVLSNQEVVNIVSSAPSPAAAARIVVESAVSAWKRKFPTSKVDDCAVVCLYLNEEDNNGQPSEEISSVEQSDTSKTNSVPDNTSQSEKISQPSKLRHVGSESHRSFAEGIATEPRSLLPSIARAKSIVNFPRFFEEENKHNGSKRRRVFC